MATIVEAEKHMLNKELYDALIRRKEDKVIQLCQQIPDGPLYTLTIHGDTVLHIATYSKQENLVLNLLQDLPENHFDKLLRQNEIGNTILHEAATSNELVEAARVMLNKAPTLLIMRNQHGESALLRACKYGSNRMFKFLDDEITKTVASDEDLKDLALLIATKYKYLVDERDGDGLTGLQLLACNPLAFVNGKKQGSLGWLIYSCEKCCRVLLWKEIQKQKQRYESAWKLAKFLIARDNSWEVTGSSLGPGPKTHGFRGPSPQRQGVGEWQTASPLMAETPLMLATISGCTEIVEEILRMYPQAIEHVNDKGRNILHVAIRYRQIQIFDILEKMEVPLMRLVRKIDKNGNSILHMIGIRAKDYGVEDISPEDMRSPALLLQENLLFFQRVRDISETFFIKHLNSVGKTAEQLFNDSNAALRMNAKEWLKGTAENCSIVAVLIATVAFAAAYTLPGGSNQNTGYPILLNQPFFVVFTLTNVLSLMCALTSVITFLSILTSPFRIEDFKQTLPQKLMLGFTLLILSVTMMIMAFASTVILVISNKQWWTKIVLSSIAFLPVSLFAFSYLPLYVSFRQTFKYSLNKIGAVCPRCYTFRLPITRARIPFNPEQPQASSFTIATCPSTTKTNCPVSEFNWINFF